MQEDIQFIIVQTKVEGVHKYENAPEEVAFLRNLHRHVFHVRVTLEVFSNDRELEFIMVKHRIDSFLCALMGADEAKSPYDMLIELGASEKLASRFAHKTFSCEDMCEALLMQLARLYGGRGKCVTVLEDGENGVQRFGG